MAFNSSTVSVGCDTRFPCLSTQDRCVMYTLIQSAPCSSCWRAALRASTGPSTICAPLGISSSGAYPSRLYPPVVEIARVAPKIRGPGIVPSSIACLISMSPYPAPSVSKSRSVVNPCSRARRHAKVARGAQRNSGLQNIFVVAALGGIFSPKKNVRVRINQPWQHGSRREIDHRSARRNLRRTIRHFFDPLAAHKNQLVLPRRSARSINQRARADDRDALRRRCGSLRANCGRNKRQRNNRQNHALFHLNFPRQRAVACRKAPAHAIRAPRTAPGRPLRRQSLAGGSYRFTYRGSKCPLPETVVCVG